MFLVGLREIFQWNTSWVSYRATLEELKREEALYVGQVDIYSTDEAFKTLAKRIELIVSAEHGSWQETAREPGDKQRQTLGPRTEPQ